MKQEEISMRRIIPEEIAKELVSVQPMPDIDFELLVKSSLWESFCDRHFQAKKEDLND